MIKLKDIIEEIKKGTKVPVFPISKREEDQAFQFIKRVVVPHWVKTYNKYYASNILNVDDINKVLKKEKVNIKDGVVRSVTFTITKEFLPAKGYYFIVMKNKKGKLIVKNPHDQSFNVG